MLRASVDELEGLVCQDFICATLDTVTSVLTAIGLPLENISKTQHLTVVISSFMVSFRLIRYKYKFYYTF